MKNFHNLITIYTRLQQSLIITFFEISKLFTYTTEVIKKMLFPNLIFTCYISLTKSHKIIYVIAGIIHKPTYSTICYYIISNNNRTHMKINHFLNILHFHVHWQLHSTENGRYHFGSYIIVIMECPSCSIIPSLTTWFTNIMKQCRPTQP